MSEHSPEPWFVVPSNDSWHVCADTPGVRRLLAELRPPRSGLGEANARRIVAAVNACAGIPREALEQLSVGEMYEAAWAILNAEGAAAMRQALKHMLAALTDMETAEQAAVTEAAD